MARKLRLLLIDDRPVTELETTHLELQPVAYGSEAEDPSLGTWAQHLRLWSDGLFPRKDADLVLIDCRFEDDYQYVPMSEALRGRDPRGLLHGAVYIARMFGRDRFHPFGFAVYSMDASGFRNDAYAQTFMGFLLAMRDSTLADGQVGFVRGRKDRELVESCANELGKTVSQNPATAWGPALQMYRQRLREVVDLQAIVVDKESWLKALDAIHQNDFSALEAGLGLTIRRFDGDPDSIQLISLFADQLDGSKWGDKTSLAATAWLESLLVLGDYLGDARRWAYEVIENGQDPESLPVPRGQDLHGQRLTRFFHACTGIIAWYDNRCCAGVLEGASPPQTKAVGGGAQPSSRQKGRAEVQLSSSNLLLELGLSDKQLNRYFKPLLDLPWGRVVDLLDEGLSSGTWPFPGQWELHRVVRDWAREVRKLDFPLAGPF